MNISGTGITPFDIEILPNFSIDTDYSFSMRQVANGDYKVVDRGAASDVYGSKFKLRGKESDIEQFLSEAKANRTAGSNVITLDDINTGEYIFGEDVDYSGGVDVTILKLSTFKQTSFNVRDLEIQAQCIDPDFTGSSSFPTLDRLFPQFSTEDRWSINKYDSYEGDFSYIERNMDVGYFEGTFLFSRAEMKSLRRYRATNRGASFTLASIPGVTYPFGEDYGSGSWTVRLLDFDDLGLWGVNNYKAKLRLTTI